MKEQDVLRDNNAKRVVDSLIKECTPEEVAEFANLKVLDIDRTQAEFLQTIGEGWAFPLNRFMNELELLECLQMKTITDSVGQRHLLSVPITQPVTADQKAALEGESRIALKCSALGDDVLAVIEKPVFFDNRREEINTRTFGTTSLRHPRGEVVQAQGEFLVSGESMRFTKRI